MKVSIIIPVYNVEKYLRACLDSICGQTLRDIEIICVNDGSTDNCGNILREYEENDNRITTISQENQGLSCARNAGVVKATGEYIYFMDSDDILDTEALKNLYTRAVVDELDLLLFNTTPFTDNEELAEQCEEKAKYYERQGSYDAVLTGPQMVAAMKKNGDYLPAVWIQLTRRAFLLENHLFFIRGVIHEDNAYTFAVFMASQRVGYDEQAYFRHRLRSNSIMTSAYSFHNVYSYYVCCREMNHTLSAMKIPQDDTHVPPEIIHSILTNARRIYNELPQAEQGKYLALPLAERTQFQWLIGDFCEIISGQNEANTRRKEIWDERCLISQQLKEAHAAKSKLDTQLKQVSGDKSKLDTQLKQVSGEKSKLDAQLKQVSGEKSKLDAQLKKASGEKSELKDKLNRTHAEKSELNTKLQKTYAEKSERGLRIRELEGKLNTLNRLYYVRVIKWFSRVVLKNKT